MYKHESSPMTTSATAKIFKNGNSQAVRLPKSFQFDVDEVEILRRGDEVILRKPRQNLSEAFDLLATMPDDFFAEGRDDAPPQDREPLA
jgi:antitoxin VapB